MSKPNAELVNDRAKLLLHRIAARRLREDPTLLERARVHLEEIRAQRQERSYMGEWEDLLSLDVASLRQMIVQRGERMTRLRLSSPFPVLLGITDPETRRRIWRNARHAVCRMMDRGE